MAYRHYRCDAVAVFQLKDPKRPGSSKQKVTDIKMPICGFTLTWELNAVPGGSIVVPLGREGSSNAASAIHAIASQLTFRTPVKIYVRFTGSGDSSGARIGDLGIKYGKVYLLFSGFAVSSEISRSATTAGYEIPVVHDLAGIADGSALSRLSHPSNPIDMVENLLCGIKDSSALALTGFGHAREFITAKNLNQDVWGKALFPWLYNLLGQDTLALSKSGIEASRADDSFSSAVGPLDISQGALKLLSPKVIPYAKFRFKLAATEQASARIADAICDMACDPHEFATQSAWDIMAGKIFPTFGIGVVPRAWNGLVVPFVPGLRTTWRTVYIDENTSWNLAKPMPRPIRSLYLLSQFGSQSGGNQVANKPGGQPSSLHTIFQANIAGVYDAGIKGGMIRALNCPSWLGDAVSSYTPKDDTNANGKPVRTSIHVKKRSDRSDIVNSISKKRKVEWDTFNSYAKLCYMTMALAGRQATIGGPLRLDIAPGSSIRVEGAPDRFTRGDQVNVPYYGTVLRVTLNMNAQQESASASFHIGYVRTEEENKAPAKSQRKKTTPLQGVASSDHPLYDRAFVGATLVDTKTNPAKLTAPSKGKDKDEGSSTGSGGSSGSSSTANPNFVGTDGASAESQSFEDADAAFGTGIFSDKTL